MKRYEGHSFEQTGAAGLPERPSKFVWLGWGKLGSSTDQFCNTTCEDATKAWGPGLEHLPAW